MTLPFRWHTLHITSTTNINNDYTCAVIYKNQAPLLAGWLQFIPFVNAALCTCLFLYLIIYVCWSVVPRKCRDVGMWVASGNCLLVALQTENLTSLFYGDSFISFYKVADSVTKQIRNYRYKTQTAITGTRPPLVASQYGSG